MSDETAVMNPLMPSGIVADGLGLHVSEDISEADFEMGCRTVSRLANFMHESLFWWLGDLINAGERLYPNKYEQWVEFTPYTIGHLRNAAWVCAHVPPAMRRRCPSIQHGAAIAPLPEERQGEILTRANREKLTARETRRLIAGDPSYKRKALPERVGNMTQRMESAFERVWTANEREWTACKTAKEMAAKVWMTAVRIMQDAK